MVRISRCSSNLSLNLSTYNFCDISAINKRYIIKKLKDLGEKEGYNINDKFINRLKDRIYSWYVDSDFLFLKFMCHKGFLEKIYIRKCII